ncbi:prepilin peptidase [Ornithinimicrobium sediminis]|uniref:prepilin peptidase n=1 Tax=Ornithinimicrobium sediminis TaxID=2904603 RepID=UPI001E42967E|nr:A24 family peptidase [Ornithinimicrobium sediminis]
MSGLEWAVVVAAVVGLAGGVPVGRWLREVTYRKPDEEDLPLPGTRWWVAPTLGLVAGVLAWRVLAAPPARTVDPGAAAGGATATQWIALLTFLVLALACVCLAAMDLDVHRLPDRIMWPTMASVAGGLTLAALVGAEWAVVGRFLLAGFVCGAGYLTLALLSLARGSLALGLGDVKLAVVLGVGLGWFGWQTVLAGMYAGFLVGGLVAIALLLTRRVGITGDLAYGPPMMVGALVGALLAPDVLSTVV